jgi:hypothetical protein
VQALKIQPKLRAHLKPVAEAKGRIARNRALPSDDLADPIGGNPDLPRKFTEVMPSSISCSARISPG